MKIELDDEAKKMMDAVNSMHYWHGFFVAVSLCSVLALLILAANYAN